MSTYAFLAGDGFTYQGSADDLRSWLNDGRITLDHVVTEIGTGQQRRVRDILGQTVATSPPPVLHSPLAAEYYAHLRPIPEIKNYFAKALFATLCIGLWPMGIVALVYVTRVDALKNQGDYEGALRAAAKANAWSNWSIGLGAVVMIFFFIDIASRAGQ